MPAIQSLLSAQNIKYPSIQPQDFIKLLYQREMGPEHAIENPGVFYRYLKEEMALPETAACGTQPPEKIGNGFYRVYLGAAAGVTPKTLARLCLLAVGRRKGSKKELKNALQQLLSWAEEEQEALSFPYSRLQKEVEQYIHNKCPAVHHSQRYRELYHPHYRLLCTQGALYLPVFKAIDAAMAQKSHVLVGIDGMSGAGKSRLAALLKQVYQCGFVHTDDFFLQPHQRGEARLAQPGGNIDYERLAPIAAKAADDRAFAYQAYNCQTQAMGQWQKVPQGPLTVLEGVYALHPRVAAPCDVRIFLNVNAKVQALRIQQRESKALAARYQTEWIPMENRYFGEFDIRESCDITIDTGSL